MKYNLIKPQIGDVIAVSDQLALRFEKVAEDLAPVWLEIPLEKSGHTYSEGSYFKVSEDVWFLYEKNVWRVMTLNERLEANRLNYFNKQFLDHF